MASARKLQLEVDRTLKKIEEGLLEFDEMYDHVQAADGPPKQRLEGELKSEIKKLQKLRDQVKTWASSAEIKNKQQLVDAREKIERRMEAFKLVEREMKTKAYSKEGLARTQAMSEEERKRMKAREWVQDAVSRLGDEIEEMEKEVETIAESGKGTKKEREIESHFENVIKTHKLHQDKLEALTRLLDNGDVKPEDVDGIQEDVNYYISQAMRPDDSTFEADFGIYDSFELLAEEAAEDHPEDDEDEAAVLARASAAAAKSAALVATAAAATSTTTAAGIGAPTTTAAALASVVGGAPITQNSQLPALNVKTSNAMPLVSTAAAGASATSTSSSSTTPTNASAGNLKSSSATVNVKASAPAGTSSNASLVPPTSPLASSSTAAAASQRTTAMDASSKTSIGGGISNLTNAPAGSGSRSGGSSFSGPSTSSNNVLPSAASTGQTVNNNTLKAPVPAAAANTGGPQMASTAIGPGMPSSAKNVATAAASSAKPPQPPVGGASLPAGQQQQQQQQLQSLSLNNQQLQQGRSSGTGAQVSGVGPNTPTTTSSATAPATRVQQSDSTNMATLLRGKDSSNTITPLQGGSQAPASAPSSLASSSAATPNATSASRMNSGGGGGGPVSVSSSTGSSSANLPPPPGNAAISAVGVSSSSSAAAAAAGPTAQQRTGGAATSSSSSTPNSTTAAPSASSATTRGNNSNTNTSSSSSSSSLSTQQAVSGVAGPGANVINTSSSSSSSSSSNLPSQKNDSFAIALARASRSASMSLPEPVLPNPWVSQSLSQLRFSASILSASLQHLPEGVDERPKPYTVKTPHPSTHPSFPTTPDCRLLDSPSAYERFSSDTLFYIFYNCQGGFQQYLAGRELKQRQGWRLHKAYRTWFKADDPHEPNETTSSSGSNTGAVYFDYDQEWAIVASSILPTNSELDDD